MSASITQGTPFEYSSTGLSLSGITSSSNGTIMYGSIQQETGYDFYVSTNGGVSWAPLSGTSPGLSGRYTDIACNGTGVILYTPWQGAGFFTSINSGSTWTDITNSLGNSQTGVNIVGVATDSAGTSLLVSTGTYLYISTNSGSTWTSSTAYTGLYRVACSSNFSVRYAIINGDICRSTDPTNTTWTVIPGNINTTWLSLTCSADGTKVFAVTASQQLYYFHNGTSQLLTTSTNIIQISSYSNGAGIIAGNGRFFTPYSLTYTAPPCFLSGTRILCQVDGVERYLPVEDLKKGILVKTSLNGYKALDTIGKATIHNPGTQERTKERLYKCSPHTYPDLKEPLYITGCHSILVDSLTNEQRAQTIHHLKRIFVTDKKYRLIACVDERAEPWASEGTYTVYHFALENENPLMNYGVYANGGLLVETACVDRMRHRSNMTLVV